MLLFLPLANAGSTCTIYTHSPSATTSRRLVVFTGSSVSPRSPPNSAPSSTREPLPPPPSSTRAALGIPPSLPPLRAGGSSRGTLRLVIRPVEIAAPRFRCYCYRIRCGDLVCVTWAGDFGCFPFPHGDGAQVVPEQPRRPQDHPLLGPCRQLGLRHRGTPLQFMLGFFRESVPFVDCNNASNVISQ